MKTGGGGGGGGGGGVGGASEVEDGGGNIEGSAEKIDPLEVSPRVNVHFCD